MTRGGPQRIPRPAGARPGLPPPWVDGTDDVRLDLATVAAAVAANGPAKPSTLRVPDSRAAAVLVALFEDAPGGEAQVVLTRRSSKLRNHKGEVAFPGGRQDPGEDLRTAALRETREEVGIEPGSVDIVGELDQLTTVASRFLIAPFVGVLRDGRPEYRTNPAEIERAFDVPLAELLTPECYREEIWDLPWGEHYVAFFELEGETVWGATARILRQLLVLITGTVDSRTRQ